MFWKKKRTDKASWELAYWQRRKRKERHLKNDHYQQHYTDLFGLTTEDYRNKKVLDIGCGPRGSLEWADVAAERYGLDPLANEYLKLGAGKHKMSYVSAPSEAIPFADGYFDIVASFNSLDHVDDLDRTSAEIGRVTKPGGRFLLVVEINHPPTPTEPITLHRESLLAKFNGAFETHRDWSCAMLPDGHDIYGSVLADRRPESDQEPAVFCVSFIRRSV